MRYSERISIPIEAINCILGIFGLALITGWEAAHVSLNQEGDIVDVGLEGVHLHPAVRTPSWWPK